MIRKKGRFKNIVIIAAIIIASLGLFAKEGFCASLSIKGVTKINRMGAYILFINYETRDRLTDNIVLKVHCKFDEKEFTFTSNFLNNIERGRHKVQMAIAQDIRKKYGSMKEYKIDIYKDGILVDTQTSY